MRNKIFLLGLQLCIIALLLVAASCFCTLSLLPRRIWNIHDIGCWKRIVFSGTSAWGSFFFPVVKFFLVSISFVGGFFFAPLYTRIIYNIDMSLKIGLLGSENKPFSTILKTIGYFAIELYCFYARESRESGCRVIPKATEKRGVGWGEGSRVNGPSMTTAFSSKGGG